jgi:hypothetical protein
MRRDHHFVRRVLYLALCFVFSGLVSTPGLIHEVRAQAGQAALAGRAVMSANTLADGPHAGNAFAQRKTIDGLKVPFDTQPVGSITAILPGEYANAWFILSESIFDNPQNSGDYLLRIYTVEANFFNGSSGDGSVTVVDWLTLADPAKKVGKNIQNGSTKERQLTGADFHPRAFQRFGDGSFWVAEASGPSLLHFNKQGQLLEAPVSLQTGAGALQGMGKLPDNKTLLVAQQSSANKATITLRPYDTSGHALGKERSSFALTAGAESAAGFTEINDHQALVIEQDSKQNNAAKFKQVFLVDFGSNPANKTPLADLLNLADPQNISTANVFPALKDAFGLGNPFKFPFADVSAIYPLDEHTLAVVNNNNVPFGLGRSASQADDTEFITVHIGPVLSLDPVFRVPR